MAPVFRPHVEPLDPRLAPAAFQLQPIAMPEPYFGLAAAGGLYFRTGTVGQFGGNLWKTDGTAAGAQQLAVVTWQVGGDGWTMAEWKGGAYFRATTPLQGDEPWRTDGTAAGTALFRNLTSGNASSSPQFFRVAGNQLLFWADGGTGHGSELWRTDGTPAGTVAVKDIAPGTDQSGTPLSSTPSRAVAAGNGKLFFISSDGTHGTRLFVTDGTVDGTTMVEGANPTNTLTPYDVTVVSNTAYFNALRDQSGIELWMSDGTPSGTRLVRDFFPGVGDADPQYLTGMNGVLYFSVYDGGTTGRELWRTDGSALGTFQVKDIAVGAGDSNPSHLTNVNGTLYFIARDASGVYGLWKSNGTTAGTVQVRAFPGDTPATLSGLKAWGDRLVFDRRVGSTREVWVSDGTAANTVKGADAPANVAEPPVVWNGRLFYPATGAATLYELVPGLVKGYAVGTGGGTAATVKMYNSDDNSERYTLTPYGASFTGGVNVATADVTGDGNEDIIVAPAGGGGPHVKVFDGTTGKSVREFFAYGATFTGGVNLAAGDVDADGFADIVTAPAGNGGPHVRVWSGKTGTELFGFFAYDAKFTGGVRVAAADVTKDGRADIVVTPGAGGGPHVKIYSGLTVVREFFAYAATFTNGVFVAAGDLNNDGYADIITGAGAGGGPHVKVWNGQAAGVLSEFFAYDSKFTGGVRVAYLDRGQGEIVTGAGPTGGPHVTYRRLFASPNGLFPFPATYTGGVFVG
jgi:ELWxxDGT repeat protein